MGPINLAQKIVLAVFVLVCGLWLTAGLHGFSIALVAMGGACVLFLSGVLTWDEGAVCLFNDGARLPGERRHQRT